TVTATGPSISIAGYNSGKVTFYARCEDLLFASHIRDNTTGSDYSSVPLHFDHLLSCLSFKIRNATSTDIETVESISLTGLHYEAEINVSNITATVSPTAETVGESDGFFAGNNLTGSPVNPFLPRGMSEEQFKDLFDCSDLTVLPQTIYGKEIKIKFTVRYSNGSSTDYSGNLGTIEGITRWQPGKKYRYNITISSEDIIFQVSEIPWIEHNVEL
ncbi:MAG: fimbrillin family protein, partial [Bacteroidales bacterium]|nr:fimbrillin family protein [Bacteroidales bacterium]